MGKCEMCMFMSLEKAMYRKISSSRCPFPCLYTLS